MGSLRQILILSTATVIGVVHGFSFDLSRVNLLDLHEKRNNRLHKVRPSSQLFLSYMPDAEGRDSPFGVPIQKVSALPVDFTDESIYYEVIETDITPNDQDSFVTEEAAKKTAYENQKALFAYRMELEGKEKIISKQIEIMEEVDPEEIVPEVDSVKTKNIAAKTAYENQKALFAYRMQLEATKKLISEEVEVQEEIIPDETEDVESVEEANINAKIAYENQRALFAFRMELETATRLSKLEQEELVLEEVSENDSNTEEVVSNDVVDNATIEFEDYTEDQSEEDVAADSQETVLEELSEDEPQNQTEEDDVEELNEEIQQAILEESEEQVTDDDDVVVVAADSQETVLEELSEDEPQNQTEEDDIEELNEEIQQAILEESEEQVTDDDDDDDDVVVSADSQETVLEELSGDEPQNQTEEDDIEELNEEIQQTILEESEEQVTDDDDVTADIENALLALEAANKAIESISTEDFGKKYISDPGNGKTLMSNEEPNQMTKFFGTVTDNMSEGKFGDRGEPFFFAQVFLVTCILIGSVPFVGNFMETLFGPVLLLVGGATIASALNELGDGLNPWPKPTSNTELTTTGVYGYVRHPIYSGLLAVALSVSIITHSASRVILTLVLFAILNMKIDYEEAEMESQFEEEYSEYKNEVTGKFFPDNAVEKFYSFLEDFTKKD